MECVGCGSAAVSERSERTARGYRRFRCRACGKQFNERSAGSLNRTQYPSDVIALVVLWRLRYKLALRDLPEMFPDPRHRIQPRGGSRLGSQAHTGID
jgi:putative transposase